MSGAHALHAGHRRVCELASAVPAGYVAAGEDDGAAGGVVVEIAVFSARGRAHRRDGEGGGHERRQL